MKERQKAILLLPFPLTGSGWHGWTHYQEGHTAADPANWTQRDWIPTPRIGDDRTIAVPFADINGSMRATRGIRSARSRPADLTLSSAARRNIVGIAGHCRFSQREICSGDY